MEGSPTPLILAGVSCVLLATGFHGAIVDESGISTLAFVAGLLLSIVAVTGQAWEAFGGAFASVGLGALVAGLAPERRGLLWMAAVFVPIGLYLVWVPLRARLGGR